MANNTLDEDLKIIANSGLPASLLPFSKEMGIISALDDEPNDVGGLTAAELKAKFDEAGLSIQKYINETLIPAVLTEDATEADRAEAERSRRAAETGRANAEFSRTQAEAARANAEQGRVTAETDRDSAEQARISKETARVQAEEDRAEAEGERASAESARLADEIDRAGAESERVKAEIARESAEADRDGKELERQANEAERKRQETLRKNAEEARQAAEEARQGAVGAQVAQAQKAAQDAGTEREEARQMAEQAGQSAAAAQAASLQIQNMTVEAKTVASDSPAAVEKTISDGVVNLKLSIPQGAKGASGEDGKSAYEQAVEGGYSGTEAEFKAMLASGPWLQTYGGIVGYIGVTGIYGNQVYGGIAVEASEVEPCLMVTDKYTYGDIMTSPGNLIVADPIRTSHAATKKYVDDAVANAGGSGGASDRVLADLVLAHYAQTGSSTWGYERTSSFRYDSDYNGVGLGVTVELIRRPELDHQTWGAYYTVNGPIVIDRLAESWKKIDAFALVPRDSSKYAKYYTPMDRYGYTTSISAIYTQLECTSLYLQEIAYAQLNALDGTGSLLAANLASKDNILIAKASTENPYMNARTFILPQLGVYLNE